MKTYTVYFIIKANNTQYQDCVVVEAENAPAAKAAVYSQVKERTGKHAFHLSTKKPERFDTAQHFLKEVGDGHQS